MAPTGNTRADVAVLENDVKHVRELVERNHRDADVARKDMADRLDKLDKSVSDLKADLNERRGAEKLATAIRTTFAGAIGAGAVKLISWLGASPIK